MHFLVNILVNSITFIIFHLTLSSEDELQLYPSKEILPNLCGVKLNRFNKINGGVDSLNNSWPWIVSLHHNFKHICAGTLLNNQWVLTAAHCFEYSSVSSYKVVIGTNKNDIMAVGGVRRSISKIIRHENYEGENWKNDIALLKLSSPVEFGKNILVACLPLSNDNFEDHKCVATGWGYTFTDGYVQSELKETDLQLFNFNECEKMFLELEMNATMQICAKGTDDLPDVCKGDSGGSLVCKKSDSKWYIAGIISFGKGCEKGSVYTKVSAYKQWIDENINKN